MKTNTATLRSLFDHRRGIAIFMATLILLSISILALSSMARLSEATQATGKALENKKLSLLATAATHIALAEITQQFISSDTAPDPILVNGGTPADFKILYESRVAPAEPLFGYRARAKHLLTGDGASTPPGTDMPLSNRNTCYDIVVDTIEVIPLAGTIPASLGGPATGYYFGQVKSVGVTSCFRKRN